ncbi:MAG TPA: glycosyltransferase family 4 protein [Candidatus Moranbacteria bacterium]|nr:glycosyltransferase family 4 protein [Candidatus Moranbacteria bacterium]
MIICYVTTGDILAIATMKRATGMAKPLYQAGHAVFIIAQDTPNNRHRLLLECPEAEALWFKSGSVINEVRQKRKLIKQCEPDLVYVCAFGFRNWVNFWPISKKIIYIIEHSELRSKINSSPLPRRLLDTLLEYISLFIFQGSVTASRYLQKFFSEHTGRLLNPKPVLYSPYAYSEHTILNQPLIIDDLKQKYSNKKIILYMGTLAGNYGIFDMLNEVKKLHDRRNDFIFIVIGSGRDKQKMLDIIKQGMGDYVDYPGYVAEEHLSSYFKLTNVFVSPLYDTIQDWARCPSKLYMYLPYQKPIVTCKIGEAAELFGDNYEFYFKPKEPFSMASIFEKALSVSENWKPNFSFLDHSWDKRTHDFLAWISKNWPHLK